MPPIEDGREMRYVEITDYSRAVIQHRDPYEVVPYFESTFTCDNEYWLRALAKASKDSEQAPGRFSAYARTSLPRDLRLCVFFLVGIWVRFKQAAALSLRAVSLTR